MDTAIIYIQANDEPGIISTISKVITNNKGNIETSKMLQLESDFSLLILVHINHSLICFVHEDYGNPDTRTLSE